MTVENSDTRFEALLEYLSYSRGFDVRAYKRAGLRRRIEKRMSLVGVEDFEAYQDYLEVHPDEFAHLFDTILINVTSFFRDADAWEHLAKDGVAHILKGKAPEEPIRVWSAGCSTGAEAYSLAMLLIEQLGVEAFRQRVKIYATDIDEGALAQARAGVYSAAEVEEVPKDYLERYFTMLEDRYVFRPDLRRSVIFGKHNLLTDAPMSHLDLLVCRNVLMYLNSDAQNQVLLRFHYALKDSGLLFLGKAEMLLTRTALFIPLELKYRIFTKVPLPTRRERIMVMSHLGNGNGNGNGDAMATRQARLRDLSFQVSPVAQLVVDHSGQVILINDRARDYFGLTVQDVGRPLQDLEVSYRPVELRSMIDRAVDERATITVSDIPRKHLNGEQQFLEIQVTPLVDGAELLGTTVQVSDMTHLHRLQEEVQHSKQELETTNEELQSTNEELETTNEELQSTNEELETTNEELQSTNEELETMNEELQSTNEELQTMNDELRVRTDDMNRANASLESILYGLRSAVVVVDNNTHVLIWNSWAEDLWGLREDEVRGVSLLTLDIGLPVDQLAGPLRACLTGECPYQEIQFDARNRRGRAFTCTVSLSPFAGLRGSREGAILLMKEHIEDIADTIGVRQANPGEKRG
ncbi:MAG: CheR family methyltransferase [Armatimonadota bacterium]